MKRENLAGALAVIFLWCLCSVAQTKHPLDKKLPPLDGLHSYGCTLQGPLVQTDFNDPTGKERYVFSVVFWAKHKLAGEKKLTKNWKLLYAYRNKRIKGMDEVNLVPGWLGSIIMYVNFFGHVDSFGRGVISTRDVVYFVSVILFFLFLSDLSLRHSK